MTILEDHRGRRMGRKTAGAARTAPALLIAVLLTGVAGCYEDTSVIVYEPGVYKGAKDPLLAKERSPEEQQALEQRFQRGQGQR